MTIAVEFLLVWPEYTFFKTYTYPIKTTVQTLLNDIVRKESAIATLLQSQKCAVGIFGQIIEPEYVLQSGDRIEIYRPLHQDPVIMRQTKVITDNRRNHRGRKNGKYRGKL
jgi:putative ubiquitin-RnfH superfamily antitoxin RatB of RatAB toxin-antitoxin module